MKSTRINANTQVNDSNKKHSCANINDNCVARNYIGIFMALTLTACAPNGLIMREYPYVDKTKPIQNVVESRDRRAYCYDLLVNAIEDQRKPFPGVSYIDYVNKLSTKNNDKNCDNTTMYELLFDIGYFSIMSDLFYTPFKVRDKSVAILAEGVNIADYYRKIHFKYNFALQGAPVRMYGDMYSYSGLPCKILSSSDLKRVDANRFNVFFSPVFSHPEHNIVKENDALFALNTRLMPSGVLGQIAKRYKNAEPFGFVIFEMNGKIKWVEAMSVNENRLDNPSFRENYIFRRFYMHPDNTSVSPAEGVYDKNFKIIKYAIESFKDGYVDEITDVFRHYVKIIPILSRDGKFLESLSDNNISISSIKTRDYFMYDAVGFLYGVGCPVSRPPSDDD